MKCLCEYDISYFKHIHRFSNVFAMTPPYGPLNKSRITKFRIFATFWILITIVIYVVSSYKKGNYSRLEENKIVFVIESLFDNILIVSIISLTVRVAFSNQIHTYEKLAESFDKFELLLNNNFENMDMKLSCRRFQMESLCLTVYMVVFHTLHAIYWMRTVELINYLSFAQRDFTNLYNILLVLLIYNYGRSLKIRYKRLCETLSRNVTNFYLRENTRSQKSGIKMYKKEVLRKLRNIRKAYKCLVDASEMFNDLYGWPILFLCMIMFIGFLEAINLFILFINGDSFFGVFASQFELTILYILWFIFLWVSGVVICRVGKKVILVF